MNVQLNFLTSYLTLYLGKKNSDGMTATCVVTVVWRMCTDIILISVFTFYLLQAMTLALPASHYQMACFISRRQVYEEGN